MELFAAKRRLLNRKSSDQPEETLPDDKFVARVTAKTRAELALGDFAPRSMLKTAAHQVPKARFRAIDCHNPPDSLDPTTVLADHG